jgi:hypothetical protein
MEVWNNTSVLRVREVRLRVWSGIRIDNDDEMELGIFADTKRLNALKDGLTPAKGGPIFPVFARSGGRCREGQ